MDIPKMVERGLKVIGADGLVNPEMDCGCERDDLAPCGSLDYHCFAAKNDPEKAEEKGCDFWMVEMEESKS